MRPTRIERNVRGAPCATTRTPPGFRSDGAKHSTIANNARIGDLYGLPVRCSNDVAPPLCGWFLLRGQTECFDIHADAAEIGSISTVVVSCTSERKALYWLSTNRTARSTRLDRFSLRNQLSCASHCTFIGAKTSGFQPLSHPFCSETRTATFFFGQHQWLQYILLRSQREEELSWVLCLLSS